MHINGATNITAPYVNMYVHRLPAHVHWGLYVISYVHLVVYITIHGHVFQCIVDVHCLRNAHTDGFVTVYMFIYLGVGTTALPGSTSVTDII